MASGILEHMTIDDVRAFDPQVVVWPIGSVEPHGLSQPYGTDVYQVDGFSRLAVEKANAAGARVLLYPTQNIGCNANGHGFPFSCRIAPSTLVRLVQDVVEALGQDGVKKIVIVNGHGGNTATLQMAMREIAHHRGLKPGPFVCIAEAEFDPKIIENPSIHGGEFEASRIMHFRPELVKPETFHDQPHGKLLLQELASPNVYFVPPWHGFVPESAGGDTRKSTAEKGRLMTEQSAENLCKLLLALAKININGDTFPFAPPE